jgi:hypothetical protein
MNRFNELGTSYSDQLNISALTPNEIAQVGHIDLNTISNAQWGYLADTSAPIVDESKVQTVINKSLQDSSTTIIDDGDATKILKFQLSGITTGNTRTLTAVDASGKLPIMEDTPTDQYFMFYDSATKKIKNTGNDGIYITPDTSIKFKIGGADPVTIFNYATPQLQTSVIRANNYFMHGGFDVKYDSLAANDDYAYKAHTQTLTNKTLTSPVLNTPIIKTSTSGISGGSVTLDNSYHIVLCDTNPTLTLPVAGTIGFKDYIIFDKDGNGFTLQRQGSDTIDGQTSIAFAGQWLAVRVRSIDILTWRTDLLYDTTFTIHDNADMTKKLKFDLNSIVTGNTITLTVQSSSGIIALADTQQNLSNKHLIDNSVYFVDSGDDTKKLAFECSGLTTATTRTLTAPDATDTICVLAASQALTNKTLSTASGCAINSTGQAYFSLVTAGSADITRGSAIFVEHDTTSYISYRAQNSEAWHLQFINDDGESKEQTVGIISTAGTQTTYATSSDRRLKKDIAPMQTCWETIKTKMLPRKFHFKEEKVDEHKSRSEPLEGWHYGFISQEIDDIFPDCIVNSKYSPTYDPKSMQYLDYGKLTPLLTQGLKEAMIRIENLEMELVNSRKESILRIERLEIELAEIKRKVVRP